MNPPTSHTTNSAHSSPTQADEQDAVDSIVPIIPLVLPVVGGVLMFLLAFIAVYMACSGSSPPVRLKKSAACGLFCCWMRMRLTTAG